LIALKNWQSNTCRKEIKRHISTGKIHGSWGEHNHIHGADFPKLIPDPKPVHTISSSVFWWIMCLLNRTDLCAMAVHHTVFTEWRWVKWRA
jgi:hypothetical protein